jgi:hypothetical protein
MRLLEARTKKLVEFPEDKIPRYAILSHTWRVGEVSYQDIQDGFPEPESGEAQGYTKIRQCCRQALLHDLNYVWIDTCCIDKRSSAELSEAINCMFKWYREAAACYAHIDDLATSLGIDRDTSQLAKCRWFTRGWTLQELLAPKVLIFYARDWSLIGPRRRLCKEISDITGIPLDILSGRDFRQASVAQRMAWASKRQTTRTEDMAYCLLGIFDVNMPMVYGEGSKAFMRLQEEIMKNSTDHSLFAWGIHPAGTAAIDAVKPAKEAFFPKIEDVHKGMFASSPADFMHCNSIACYRSADASPYSISNNNRIRMNLTLLSPAPSNRSVVFYAILECHRKDDFLDDIAIPLIKVAENQFFRLSGQNWFPLSTSQVSALQWEGVPPLRLHKETIHIATDKYSFPELFSDIGSLPIRAARRSTHGRISPNFFVLRSLPSHTSPYWLKEIFPSSSWREDRRIVELSKADTKSIAPRGVALNFEGNWITPRGRDADVPVIVILGLDTGPLLNAHTPFCATMPAKPGAKMDWHKIRRSQWTLCTPEQQSNQQQQQQQQQHLALYRIPCDTGDFLIYMYQESALASMEGYVRSVDISFAAALVKSKSDQNPAAQDGLRGKRKRLD